MFGWLLVGWLGCTGTEPAKETAAAVDTAPTTDTATATPTPPPPVGERVFFVEPADGATVKSPLKVVFGVEGKTVAPAGEVKEGTGHHHLIIDGQPIPGGTVVPADEKHIHFGKGQTETEVELAPGPHTLTLQFADGSHGSFGEGLSATISVVVE